MSLGTPRHPDGTYVDWATQELQKKHGYTTLGFIRDQHGWRLGAAVESPSKKRGKLLVGKYAIKAGGYKKSMDAQVILDVIEEDEYLLLGLRNEEKFYFSDAESLENYLDVIDKEYNGVRSLNECFSVDPPLCPICPEPRKLIRRSHEDHPSRPYENNLIEVYNWRIKFCNVDLREADFTSIDKTVGPRPTFYEKWLGDKLKKELPYLRTAEFRGPQVKKQFGYFPDFIPLKGNLVLEVDTSTKEKTRRKRERLLEERGYRLYSIRNLPKVRQEYEQGNPQKLRDLIADIKSRMERPLERWTPHKQKFFTPQVLTGGVALMGVEQKMQLLEAYWPLPETIGGPR